MSDAPDHPESAQDLSLSGLLVVDMSQFLSGPYASLRLMDLGARVIKIERPDGGDLSRRLYLSDTEIGGDSTIFHAINRNKESLAIDLKNPEDIATLKRLLGRADVMMQNFRPGVIERLGLDYATVRAINPRLVYASITGYGDDGPWVTRPGQDLLAQARSGLMWLNGDETQGPVPFGLAVADMLAGAAAAQAILAGLVRRGTTGRGSHVETSLLEALVDFQFEVLTTHLNDGRRLPRRSSLRSAHAYLSAPYGVYPTRDGFLAIAMTPIAKLADLLDLKDLEPYRNEPSTWFMARDEIKAIIAQTVAAKETDHWLAILEPADIWCAKVLQWPELLASEGFKVLDMLQTVERDDGTRIMTTRSPIRVDGLRPPLSRAAPWSASTRSPSAANWGSDVSAPITLRGMTWSHPRGYDPMVACSAAWREMTGVAISWDKRSLQDFESFPVEDLARRYDLIVIDHPHVGQITAEGCLSPLDTPARDADVAAMARGSVGASFSSYTWQGRQWALPIDAATQVQAWRSDRLQAPLATWSQVLELARSGGVLCPMRPPHSLMCFYTLTAILGHPCSVLRGPLVDRDAGLHAYRRLGELVALIDPHCFNMDPIAVFESMAEPTSPIGCAPLIYGYVSYAAAGFRPVRLGFADMPVFGDRGPVGSALGGTGIAVSARPAQVEAATDFAFWIASAAVQRGLYASSGGQPGHGSAWADPIVNAPVAGFYSDTRATLDHAWVRPRHNGYMPFQHWAADRLNRGLQAREDGDSVLADLDRAFAQSFPAVP